MKIARGLVCAAVACCLLALGGCRKRLPPQGAGAPASAPDAGGVTCPRDEDLVRQLAEPGRTVRAHCLLYAPGFYWLGVALSYDPKAATPPRLLYLSGGFTTRVYDIEPAPTAAIAELIKKSEDVEVQIRKGRSESRLVRLGVLGKRAGGEADEVGLALQLVAHKQPQIVWTGAGDERRRSGSCLVERRVDFEMPFGDRLEMVTSYSAPASCPTPPSSQQTVDYRGVSIKPGRPLPAR